MAKYLNIDDLAPEPKILTLKGIEYPMHQISVGEFIEIMRGNEEEQNFSEAPLHEKIDMLITQIQRAFPTAPEEDLRGLSIDQLTVIFKFIQGTLEEEQAVKAEAKGKN